MKTKKISIRWKARNIMFMLFTTIIIGIMLCFVLLLFFSPGKPKPFTDSHGNILKNSINTKEFVEINGVRMGMFIKSKDITKPVLLFVHGGPGMPEDFMTEDYPTGLEDEFTVVWWHQRGAGLSYNNAIDMTTMTTQQFVEDTIAVTNYLRERFGQQKIYLMAHSWGTYIAIQALQKAPQLYNTYISVAQITQTSESERLAYDYMLNYYTNTEDKKMLKKLQQSPYLSKQYASIRDSMMHKAGIGTLHQMNSVITGIFFRSLANTNYTLTEKVNLWRGKIFSAQTSLRQQMYASDIRKMVPSVKVPVYFLSGIYDYTVNYSLTQDYFNTLDAPMKGFYLFNNSAHSPMFEEPEKIMQIIREDILNKTNALANFN